MNKVIVDQSTFDKLRVLNEPAELCDETGRTLGYFRPSVDKALYEQVVPPVSEEELRQRLDEGGGRALGEILSDLEENS